MSTSLGTGISTATQNVVQMHLEERPASPFRAADGLDIGALESSKIATRLRSYSRVQYTSSPIPKVEETSLGVEHKESIGIRLGHYRAHVAPKAQLRPSLQPLQEWEGYVTAFDEDNFQARLIDITAGDKTEREVVEFPRADLSGADEQRLTVGAIFRWTIGYYRTPSGTKQRTSKVVFRHLPAHSPSDLAEAERRAEQLQREIEWD